MSNTPVAFAGSIALCHFLRLHKRDNQGQIRSTAYAFQNFYFGDTIEKDDQKYFFLPFGFSGISTSKSGDVEPATLLFPNDDKGLARTIVSEALRGGDIDAKEPEKVILPYIATIEVNLVDIDSKKRTVLYTYTGICGSANWDDTQCALELGSIIDAVNGNIPTRTLRRDLVGNLPTSSTVRIR